tara:strand:- start:16 stop:216 length:201 start_codon:yes stop_codon:yes gene_type:complete
MSYEITECQQELKMNHEPSLNHWAKIMADRDILNGEETVWDDAFDHAYFWLDAEYNYNYEYRALWN